MSSRLIASCIRISSLCLHVPLYLCSIIFVSLTCFYILALVHTDAVNMDIQVFHRFWVQLFGIRSKSQKWSSWIIRWFCFGLWSKHHTVHFASEPLIFLPAVPALMTFCHLLRNSHHNMIQVLCSSYQFPLPKWIVIESIYLLCLMDVSRFHLRMVYLRI